MLAFLGRFYQFGPLLLLAAAVAVALDSFLSIRLPEFELRGRRAGNRLRALDGAGLSALLLPIIHVFTAFTLLLPVGHLRARLDVLLHQADEPLGLTPSEVLGICLLCAVAAGVAAAWLLSPWAALPALVLGAYLPYAHTRSAAFARVAEIGRSIPRLTDLIVLCMESGMDFLGTVRLLLGKTVPADGQRPIHDELLHLLNELHLGRDRRSAFEQFSQRLPSEPVRMFITSVLQAEEKGMSLREVLRIQAEVMRHKRLQEAEDYIQVANLQMMAPILLVIVALLATVLVPMVTGMNEQLILGGA